MPTTDPDFIGSKADASLGPRFWDDSHSERKIVGAAIDSES